MPNLSLPSLVCPKTGAQANVARTVSRIVAGMLGIFIIKTVISTDRGAETSFDIESIDEAGNIRTKILYVSRALTCDNGG
jgi:hypothetical protein